MAAGLERSATPTPGALGYRPALDGLRGLAVAAVLLFHGGYQWLPGGFLGVTVFFVLSGFLITSLLLLDGGGSGRADLRRFWLRRARRLMPAIAVLLALVFAYSAWAVTRTPNGLFGDVASSLTWVANWRFVFAHRSYGDLTSAPSPLQHMWSLAVEEQFYLVLPVLVAVVLGANRRSRRRRLTMVGLVLAGIVASSAASWLLYSPGASSARAYYGTDARAAEPLVGVLLALVLVGPAGVRRLRQIPTAAFTVLGVASAVGLGYLLHHMTEHGQSLFRGGLLAAALCSAGLIASAMRPGTIVNRVLRAGPLVWIGKISYGVYLFHWPLFLWMTARRTGLSGNELFGARCLATAAVATASYFLIEQPIRTGRMTGFVAAISWADVSVASLGAVAILTYSATPAVGSTVGKSVVSGSVQGLADAPVLTASAAQKAAGANVVRSSAAVQPAGNAPAVKTFHGPGINAGNIDAPPAGGFKKSPVPPVPQVNRRSDGTMPLKVVVVGDSMGYNVGEGLNAWSAGRSDIVTYDLSIRACPISRAASRRIGNGDDFPFPPDCQWWAQSNSDRLQALRQFNPEIVVLQDGMNEMVDQRIPSWSTYEHPGQTQFDSWLLNEYIAAIGVFKANGASVFALNAVCADFENTVYVPAGQGPSRLAAMDRTNEALAAQGAQPVDYESHICPNGRFTETVDGVSDARPDGYHLSSDAAFAVAQRWLGPMLLSRPRTPGVGAP